MRSTASRGPAKSLPNTCASRVVHIIEADLIRLRTKKGMRVAKAKGRLRGRKPKLNARQEAHLVSLIAARVDHTLNGLCLRCAGAALRIRPPEQIEGR